MSRIVLCEHDMILPLTGPLSELQSEQRCCISRQIGGLISLILARQRVAESPIFLATLLPSYQISAIEARCVERLLHCNAWGEFKQTGWHRSRYWCGTVKNPPMVTDGAEEHAVPKPYNYIVQCSLVQCAKYTSFPTSFLYFLCCVWLIFWLGAYFLTLFQGPLVW